MRSVKYCHVHNCRCGFISYVPLTIPLGVAGIDICTAHQSTEPDLFIDLSQYANPEFGSSPNDITVVGNTLYVTDFQGGYVWRIVLSDEQHEIIEIFLSYDPAVERPNGIENINNFLLISLMDSDTLRRVDATTKEESSVIISPATVYASGDGLRFDSTKEVLYVARHNADSVLALVSCDTWHSAQVATDFLASCLLAISSPGVTTLAMSGSDLWVFCSDDFGAGPYAFNRISQSSSKVFSGAHACLNQGSTDPVVVKSDSDDCRDDVVSDSFFWVSLVLGVALLLVIALHCWRIYLLHQKEERKDCLSLDDNLLLKA